MSTQILSIPGGGKAQPRPRRLWFRGIDHTERYVHGGAPRTMAGLNPFPGIYLWRDPHGAHYLVDYTGTRRLQPPHTSSEPESRVETWFSDITLRWAA